LYKKEQKMNTVVYDSLMIDLETMGTGPNAAVIQLGAVAFNSVNGLTDPDGMSRDIDLHSSVLLGGEVDAATAHWWRERGGLELKNPVPLRSALLELAAWVKNLPKLERVWSQGANFDVPILEGYYRRAGLDRAVDNIRKAAAELPPGKPGDCELCGEWSGRLIRGVCAPCRDRFKLP